MSDETAPKVETTKQKPARKRPKKKPAPKRKAAVRRKPAAKKKPAKGKKKVNRHGRKGHAHPLIFWLTTPQKKAFQGRAKHKGITMSELFRRIAKLPKSPGDK